MNTVLYVLLTLVLLSIMVVIHELGHFLFAKLFKVTVLEFSIGMGPALFTTGKKKKDKEGNVGESFRSEEINEEKAASVLSENEPRKTVFSVRAFPIGGYVSMAGEDGESTDINAFCHKPVWQRFIITVAGAVMNILLGITCMFCLVGIESAADGYLASNTVAQFEEQSISDKCENPLAVGDRIIAVDGVSVHTGNELVYEILNQGYEPIDIVVIRDGERLTLEDVTFPTEISSGVAFGSCDFKVAQEKVSFGSVVKHSVFRSFSSIKVIFDSIKDLVGGRYGVEAVSGPIGMADAVGTATKGGFASLLYLFILITMNLGIFNLLPFPALDGGRIIFLLVEAILRRPVRKELEQAINTIGILLLFALMILVTFKDIINLF